MEMDSHGGYDEAGLSGKKNLPNNFVAQTSECS